MSAEEHIQYVPEPAGVDLRVVVGAAIAALVLLVGAIVGFYRIYQVAVPIKTMPKPELFAQPRVTTHAADVAELHQLAAEQTARLNTWRWSDAQHTRIQIPIARAMQLLVQNGGDAYAPLLPARPALTSPTAAAEKAITPSAPPNGENPAPKDKQP